MVRLTMTDGTDRYMGMVASEAEAHRMISAFSEWIKDQPDGTRLVFTVETMPETMPAWRRMIAKWFHAPSRWVSGWDFGKSFTSWL